MNEREALDILERWDGCHKSVSEKCTEKPCEQCEYYVKPFSIDTARAVALQALREKVNAEHEIQRRGAGRKNNMNDDWDNSKFLLILMVLIVIACIVGPVLIWQSDMPTWLKWLLTK